MYNIKTHEDFIPKTIYECDREIVESDEIEDNAKWVPWVNPKDGKMYTVIKTADNEDGTKTVRVLDEDGELVKECDIRPKKIIVLDDARYIEEEKDRWYTAINGDELSSHGFIVALMAKRNNPLADVEILNTSDDNPLDYGARGEMILENLQNIIDRLNGGEKIDAINMSFGQGWNLREIFEDMFDEDINVCNRAFFADFMKCYAQKMDSFLYEERQLLEQITKHGTRVFVAAGNDGSEYYMSYIGIDGVELVGGLASNGKVSPHSSSSRLTPHFEKFDYPLALKRGGINVTGLHGADFSYPEFLKKYEGKKPEGNTMTDEEHNELISLEYSKRYDYINKLKASKKDKFLLQENRELTIENNGIPVYGSFDFNMPLYSSFKHLTVDKNGYLVPYIPDMKSGTSYASPTRAAKVMLNDTMQEILNG